MTSKERVQCILKNNTLLHDVSNHKNPDRVPRFIWLGGEVRRRLSAKYGISNHELDIKLGNDILQTWVSINGEMERDVPQGTKFVDDFGITWKRDGEYNMVIHHPLNGLDAVSIKEYMLPDPHNPARFALLENLISVYGDEYFIGADVSGVLFEPAYHLRHMETLMIDLADENEEASVLLDKLMEFNIALSLECIARGADWIWMGDDLGSQHGMLMSPGMWRKAFKPRMRKIINAIREVKPDIPIAYHSCGSMYPIIKDLIEIGITVLNPIQESAVGMTQASIKAEFGDKLTLMCGLDTQQFLNRATPEEVYSLTKSKINELGKDGGYIFSVSHHVQGDTPDANIHAMLDALSD